MGYRVYGSKHVDGEGIFTASVNIGKFTDDPPPPGWSRKMPCPCCGRRIVIRCEGEPLSADDKQWLRDDSRWQH